MRLSRTDEEKHIKRCMEQPTLTSAFDEPYAINRQPFIWPKPIKYLSPREKQMAAEDIELNS